MPSTNSAIPSQANISGQFDAAAASKARSPSAAPEAVKMWTAKASAAGDVDRGPSAGIAAPVEPHDFGGASLEIPVAAEGAHARGLGARDGHVLADPVAGVA